jgi:hypothetical protein
MPGGHGIVPSRLRGGGTVRPACGAAPPRQLAYAGAAERQSKMLGSLPVICSFCRRLDIATIIDDLVPIRPVAAVAAGRAVEAMVCNRLTSPAPPVQVEGWAATWAVEEILGIAPASLNDEKLGRTLDAIASCLEQITSAAAVRAVTAFGIDISRLRAPLRPPQGPAPGPAAGSGRCRGRRRPRDPGLPPRLRRRRRRGVPGDRGRLRRPA